MTTAAPSRSASAARTGLLNKILVLDGDAARRRQLQILLGAHCRDVAAAASAAGAERELERSRYDALFARIELIPDEYLASASSPPYVVGLAATAHEAVAALDGPASDCLVDPVEAHDVAIALRRAAKHCGLAAPRAGAAAPPAEDERTFAGMVGVSRGMRAVFRTLEKVAQHKATVLVTGESGTGKELVARAIHDLGPRREHRFVAINCGAIPANLLESELFGHRRGAFTDAVRDKAGLFEEADHGTLFLDEVGELPLGLQVKLLRSIQEEEIRRIGDNETISIDVRVIAATLRDLGEDVRAGRFREDLFYRLNVLPLQIPALRERPDDIPPLVEHFVARYRAKHGSEVEGVSEDALALLQSYSWPGNIRELENTIERAMVLCDSRLIEARLLEDKLVERPDDPIRSTLASGELSIKKTTRIIEEELIRRALATTEGNRTNAAKLLEISHRALLYKIKEYGL